MGMRIFWTEKAQSQLEDIFTYYKAEGSVKTAKNLVKKLVDRTLILENNPEIGQKDEFLTEREEDFRYLVQDHYKVVYWIEKN